VTKIIKIAAVLGLLFMCSSCARIEPGETSIGRVERLTIKNVGGCVATAIVAKHGQITVWGQVSVSKRLWTYVNEDLGTVRLVNRAKSGTTSIVYKLCEE